MLVSVNNLCRYMGGIEPRDGMREEMADVIAGVQEALELYLNRPVEKVQVREYVLSNSKGFVHLSVSPVHEILRYGVNVVPAVPGTTVLIPPVINRVVTDEDRSIDLAPGMINGQKHRIVPGGFYISSPNTPVMVDYVGGYIGYSDNAIKSAIKRVAAREWSINNVDTVGQRQGLPGETEVGDQRSIGWAQDELRSLSRKRRRVVRRG